MNARWAATIPPPAGQTWSTRSAAGRICVPGASEVPERRRRKDRREDAVDARTLPHDLDAERAVLGAILVHNDAYAHAARELTAADFYRVEHRHIFSVLTTLLEPVHG